MSKKKKRRNKNYAENYVARRFFRECGFSWFYKIPDVGLEKKPFDYIAFRKGKLYAFEFKRVGAKVLPHQIENLRKVHGFLVWWRKNKNKDKNKRKYVIVKVERLK